MNILQKKIMVTICIFITIFYTNLQAQSILLSPESLLAGQINNSQNNISLIGNTNPFIRSIAQSKTLNNTNVVSNNKSLLVLGAEGYNGNEFSINNSLIQFSASETWTNTANGTRMFFKTQPNNCISCPLDFFTIGNNGNFTLSTSLGTELTKFYVKKNVFSLLNSTPANACFEDDATNYVQLASPDVSISGILFGTPSFGNNSGGIIYTANRDLQFRTATNDTRMTIAQGGNVGINTTSPSAKLEIAGNYSFEGRKTISVSTINNLNLDNNAVVYVNGNSTTVTGIAGGVDGMIIRFVVSVNSDLTFSQLSSSSSIGNRIETGEGADLTISQGGGATLIYDGDNSIWRLIDIKL